MVGGADVDSIRNVRDNAQEQSVPSKILSPDELKSTFPYLNLPSSDIGVFEDQDAGYINPRKLVEAQKLIASRQGCTYVDDVVNQVTRVIHSDGTYAMNVVTEKGKNISCNRVLLATGAFSTFRDLLPDIEPEQELCPLTVALVEVNGPDAEKLK